MTPYQKPPAAIDCQLEEIPEGKHRVKLIASIVNVDFQSLTINDGTGQVTLKTTVSSSDFEVGTLGRFVAEILNHEQNLTGTLIAWHSITADQAKRYRRLVKIERRVPKK